MNPMRLSTKIMIAVLLCSLVVQLLILLVAYRLWRCWRQEAYAGIPLQQASEFRLVTPIPEPPVYGVMGALMLGGATWIRARR